MKREMNNYCVVGKLSGKGWSYGVGCCFEVNAKPTSAVLYHDYREHIDYSMIIYSCPLHTIFPADFNWGSIITGQPMSLIW